jgi:putative ABC transport system ATP-binding protein
MTPHFEASDASRAFRGALALDRVSFAVPRGAFLAVTGPSGGGKTTLLSLLAALDRPTGGVVRFLEIDVGGAREPVRAGVRRRIGLVFQSSPMIRGLPLWENVTYPLVPRGLPTRERRRLAGALLDRVGIRGRDDARPEELSLGERQRVGVARALACDPEAILADEPTSNLDRESASLVVKLLREFHAGGRTVIAATHDPAIESLATTTLHLRHGRVA